MTSIGETLRRERLRQGLDLQYVSQSTKIGTRMLQAMEAGDFTKLPGGVFTRSFIRQYATALGMDTAALEPELRALNVEGDEATRGEVRKPDIAANRPGLSFSSFSDRGPQPNSLLASAVWVVLALLVCGGVYYVMNRDTGAHSTATAMQAKVEPKAEPKPEPKPVRPAERAPEQSRPARAATTPAPNGPVQVVLSASEAAWVSVAADGKSAYVGVLRPHQKKEISAAAKVKLVTGNAGGLKISLNGKPVDAIGPRGRIRAVELTQTGAHVIPRTRLKPGPLL